MFVIGLGIGFSANASTEENLIPSWIKSTASFWIDGKIEDKEFVQALQYLVEKDILKIPSQESKIDNISNNEISTKHGSFTNTKCLRNESIPNMVSMTGKYTNGDTAYEQIELNLILLDKNGDVIEIGSGVIWDVESYQTKYFDADAFTSLEYETCEIEIDYVDKK
jgi:hypothetical protein